MQPYRVRFPVQAHLFIHYNLILIKRSLEKKIKDVDKKSSKKTDYNTRITEIENKIPDTSSLIRKNSFNAKVKYTIYYIFLIL